jgi:hypothetical protein
MVALLSRLGESVEKSVDDDARLDQIAHCTKVVAVRDIFGRGDAAVPKPVRPG